MYDQSTTIKRSLFDRRLLKNERFEISNDHQLDTGEVARSIHVDFMINEEGYLHADSHSQSV
jgi:hypothetical protein